jgi:hypothetical protein
LPKGHTTEAQVEANSLNPAGSAGPGTQEDRVLPSESNEFNQFTEDIRHDLAPEGAIEGIFAAEITRAAWRLRRCANVEAALARLSHVEVIRVDKYNGMSKGYAKVFTTKTGLN